MEPDRIDFLLLFLYGIAFVFSVYNNLWPMVAIIVAFALVTFIQRYSQEKMMDEVINTAENRYSKNMVIIEEKIDKLTSKIEILQKELMRDVYLIDKGIQTKKDKDAVNYSNFAEKIIQMENKLNKIKTFLEE